MLDERNNNPMNNNQNSRNLSDVFRELQETRYSQVVQSNTTSNTKRQKKSKAKVSFIDTTNISFDNKKSIKLSNLMIVFVILVLVIIAIFPMNVFSVETGDT